MGDVRLGGFSFGGRRSVRGRFPIFASARWRRASGLFAIFLIVGLVPCGDQVRAGSTAEVLRKAQAARAAELARQEAARRAKEQEELKRLAEQARREAAAVAKREAEVRRAAQRAAREAYKLAKQVAAGAKGKAKPASTAPSGFPAMATHKKMDPGGPALISRTPRSAEKAFSAAVQKHQEARSREAEQRRVQQQERVAELEKQRLAELLSERQAKLERQRLAERNNQREAQLARLNAAEGLPAMPATSSANSSAPQEMKQPKADPAASSSPDKLPGAMRVGAPPAAKDADDKPDAPDKKDAADQTSTISKKDVPAQASQPRGLLGTAPPPPVGELSKKNELLARNLSQDALRQLKARGYGIANLSRGVTRVEAPEGVDARAALKSEISLLQVFENYIYRPYRGATVGHSETSSNMQGGVQGCGPERCYGPQLINWTPQLAACAKGIKVGIIDTGFDYEHPTFAGLQPRVAKTPKGKPARVAEWHGTSVFALLAGSPHSGTPGLIRNAEYFIADAFFADSSGEAMTDSETILWALELFDRFDVQVVNMSLVGPRDELVHEMMRQMTRKGVVFIAAAGNGGPSAPPGYPAAYSEVIAVTAVDQNKMRYPQANRGSYIDVAAPGVRIWTALPGRREGSVTGTSFAAPFVTAIVAATYQASPMGMAVKASWSPTEAKAETLARLNVDKPGRDRDAYGLGVVTAPSTCAPPNHRLAPVTQVKAPDPGWVTSTHRVAAEH